MTTSSSAVMDANTLDLMFDGGSLHRGDINPSQLIENLTVKNVAGTSIADAIASAEVEAMVAELSCCWIMASLHQAMWIRI